MKCPYCNGEMLVDRIVEKAQKAISEVHWKCPNKQCENYGYKVKKPAAE